MPIALFTHNRHAYESAVSMLAETGKAAVIHPTGTGKSFIGFKLCEDNPNATVCWLSPSEYIFKTQIENLVAAGANAPTNVRFFTYAKLPYLSEEDMAAIQPDYIILDEFHRCGADVWGDGVSKLLNLYGNTPVLGLSATNIRYLDNQRDMADELFDSNIASEMTLGEAIVRGILAAPKYVISVYSCQNELSRYQERVRRAKSKVVRDAAQKYLDALRRALDKADGLDEVFARHMENKAGKYIVFCANVEHLNELVACARQWFARVDDSPHIYKAYSDDPETSSAFAKFKADASAHLKLLFCIDMLNEGIHVEDVSGVILFRPTISPIIYKQQIGRALSASKSQSPIIFDVVNNFENLYSIGAIDQEMRQALSYYRELGQTYIIVNERVSIADQVRDCRELFDELNDTLSASWDMMFDQARSYYEKHGDLDVPIRYKSPEGYTLGSWIAVQRRVRTGQQYGSLSSERIARLDSIGMIWENRLDLAWSRYFNAAKQYYEQHGNLDILVSHITDDGLRLGQWICNVRQERASGRQGRLTPKRVSELDSIGMLWDKFSYLWEQNYLACADYYMKHGNLDIPSNYVSEKGLRTGLWVQRLRRIRQGFISSAVPLTESEISRLDAIGMIWIGRMDQLWEEGYQHAVSYHTEFGDLNVPVSYVCADGYRLGAWIKRHITPSNGRGGTSIKVTPDRREKLTALGMIWKADTSWESRYTLAKKYFEQHGNLKVPGDYVADGVWLGKWLNDQKLIYEGKRHGKSLTTEQVALLEAIGMEWKSWKLQVWEERYNAVRQYFHEHGTLQIPRDVTLADGKTIGNWFVIQRKYRNQGKLTTDQIEKLDELGFTWEREDSWEVGYAHAEAYYQEYGTLSINLTYVCSDGYRLGRWLANQKYNYSNPSQYRSLNAKQVRQLESIGIVWKQTEALWDTAYQHACDFHRKHGHLHVPANYKTEDGFLLYGWLYEQIKKQRAGKLTPEQVNKLSSIGCDWLFPKERFWEKAFACARQYFLEHGNLNIASTYRTTSGFTLGAWVRRMEKLKDSLSEDRVQRLCSIGMELEEN